MWKRERYMFGAALIILNIWMTILITEMFLKHGILYGHIFELVTAVLGILLFVTIAAPLMWKFTFLGDDDEI